MEYLQSSYLLRRSKIITSYSKLFITKTRRTRNASISKINTSHPITNYRWSNYFGLIQYATPPTANTAIIAIKISIPKPLLFFISFIISYLT